MYSFLTANPVANKADGMLQLRMTQQREVAAEALPCVLKFCSRRRSKNPSLGTNAQINCLKQWLGAVFFGLHCLLSAGFDNCFCSHDYRKANGSRDIVSYKEGQCVLSAVVPEIDA